MQTMTDPVFQVQVADVPDREKCVAEVWFGDSQVCEVNRESGSVALEVYPNPAGGPWSFEPEAFIEAIGRAVSALTEYDA